MDDLLNSFTHNLRRVLIQAAQLAASEGKTKIEPLHLFTSLTNQAEGVIVQTAAAKVLQPAKKTKLSRSKKTSALTLSPHSRKIILEAAALAEHFNHSHIGTEHLFASILDSRNPKIQGILRDHNVNSRKVRGQILAILKTSSKIADILETLLPSPRTAEPEHEHEHVPHRKQRAASALEYFAVHLTDPEHVKRLDPLIGRDREVSRLMRVLARRTKNNPVLLGAPGVGKTAIVEGLAQKIVYGDVPEALADKRIYSLNLTALVAGSAFRGELEMRFNQVLEEVRRDPNVILFVDEIHNLVGAGSSNGSLDASNIVKPALARGELRCIGATTFQEYKKYIEEDAALERRFQPITVDAPSVEQAETILIGLIPQYEQYHRVTITPEAARAAVRLSDRYIPEKFLPDKAIDLIDEAAAKARIDASQTDFSREIYNVRRDIARTTALKEEMLYNRNDLAAAETLLAKESELAETLRDLESKQEAIRRTQPRITHETIAEIIASSTGIPIASLMSDERQKLLALEDRLSEAIIGQDEAKKAVASFVRRAKSGLLDRNRPLASFAFLGPSGVGKTELARTLANEIFGADGLLKLDMSEFSESFSVSRLIGAPSGYIGYKEGGRLTEAIRQRPHSLILFDEIEKAHPRVAQTLLQILEDGCLTDAAGKKVDFSNTMIILTSNIGSRTFSQSSFGFSSDEQKEHAQKNSAILGELKDFLNPELVNRLDRVIVFEQLSESHIKDIVSLRLKELREKLLERGIDVRITPAAVRALVSRASQDRREGARRVRHIIENVIEGKIAECVLALPSSQETAALTIDCRKKEFICTLSS